MTSKETPQQQPLDDAQLEQASGGMSGIRTASAGSGNSNDVVLSDDELTKVSGSGSVAGGSLPKGPVGGPGG